MLGLINFAFFKRHEGRLVLDGKEVFNAAFDAEHVALKTHKEWIGNERVHHVE